MMSADRTPTTVRMLAFLLLLARAEAAGLEIDYLPPLVYKGDPVTLLVRAANEADRPASFRLHAKLTYSAGAQAETVVGGAMRIGPGETAAVTLDLPSSRWRSAEVSLLADEAPAGTVVIRGYDEDDALPRLVARAGRLHIAECGTPVVLFLTQRSAQSDREWILWKRLAKGLERTVPPTNLAVIGSAFGSSQMPRYLHSLSRDSSSSIAAFTLPGVTDRKALQPILADLAAALRALEGQSPVPQMLVWVADSSDARRATSIWNFRKATDFILHRARKSGVGRVGVLLVPEPGVPRTHVDVYAEEMRQSCAAYRAEFAVLADFADPAYWRAERGTALLRGPNPAGHERLVKLVLDAIRP